MMYHRCQKDLLSFLFADGTSMLIHGKDVSLLEEEMNRELCKVTTWLKVNKLSLNITKTHNIVCCLVIVRSVREGKT